MLIKERGKVCRRWEWMNCYILWMKYTSMVNTWMKECVSYMNERKKWMILHLSCVNHSAPVVSSGDGRIFKVENGNRDTQNHNTKFILKNVIGSVAILDAERKIRWVWVCPGAKVDTDFLQVQIANMFFFYLCNRISTNLTLKFATND